ncbi:hypothetical protein [Bordetella trematum]|uniref:hypothetical protein n=1 Tax=Bordetella trematum TaxID=123899 RepID=UPI0012E843C4|nr:hypothetical protein [Bordetella trematum]
MAATLATAWDWLALSRATSSTHDAALTDFSTTSIGRLASFAATTISAIVAIYVLRHRAGPFFQRGVVKSPAIVPIARRTYGQRHAQGQQAHSTTKHRFLLDENAARELRRQLQNQLG